jgi:predicted PurR-regulated permease PerM
VATWLAFLALGVEQAAVWGVLAGIFNSIPYFGPVIVTGATSVVAFLQFGNLRMAILVGAVSLAITSLEGFLLTPWLTSRATRMNAVAIFVGLLFWGWVWNVWGMLLAVPMLMVMKAVCDHVEDFKGIGELLGD